MFKRQQGRLFVLLAHPGGPFWRQKDEGAWSIPKGERTANETPEAAARREFAEELGAAAAGPLRPLGRIRQRGGKEVEAFALEGDSEVDSLCSNQFEIEWPPHSGRSQSFPEIERAGTRGESPARPLEHDDLLGRVAPSLSSVQLTRIIEWP